MKNELTKCKNCGEEISKKASICPKCGVKNKKPFYKRAWFIALVIVVVVVLISSLSGGEDGTVATTPVDNTETTEISYTEYTAAQLISDLEENALRAEQTYDGQYVKITGELSNIDSDGSYISIKPGDGSITFNSIMCYIKNEEQLNHAIQLNIGDTVVVKGKIKDVGEVLGYQLDIDSFE